jgi:ABC-type transport system substrate-binding protein
MPGKKIVGILLAAMWLASGCTGCSPSGTPPAATARGPRRLCALIVPQPGSLIPLEGDVYVDGQITGLIFSNLVKANYLGNLAPQLAENWEISPDHREYTFHLRKGVRFHDGRPFTAADVVFTLEKLIEKAGDKYAELHYLDGCDDYLAKRSPRVRGLQVLDDHTIRVRLSENFKFFLQFLAAEHAAIVPKNYAGLSEEAFRRRPIGTGPFRLVGTETRGGQQPFLVFKLERNRGYFAAAGNLDAIDFYAANSQVDPGRKERFDLLYLSLNEISGFANNPDYRVINSSPAILNFLVLNPNENSQMRDPRVRRLIQYGINREELVHNVFKRQAQPAHSMMPFGLLGHNPYYRLDYSRAAAIRAELPAGTIRFTLMTVANDKRELVAAFIARALARFNIEVQVVTISDQYDYFVNRIYHTDTSVVLGGIPDYPASYHFLSHLVEPSGYYNVFGFTFPGLNARIRTLPSSTTMDETRTLAEINAALENDALYIPLYYVSNFIAIRSRVRSIGFKYGEYVDFASLEVAP